MAAPANLYPGLNEVSDVLEEMPLEVSRYMTLLREIDAKCIHTVPELNGTIDHFFQQQEGLEHLQQINGLFQELMPSLEEKMHVSALAYESLSRLTARLELAYEVAIKNTEIPVKLRLGNDDHPAMHLHHELMAKIDSKTNSKSSQALKSESRREAMAARKTGGQGSQGFSPNVEGAAAGPGGGVLDGSATGSPDTYYETQVPADGRKRRAMGATGAAAAAAHSHHHHHHQNNGHNHTHNQNSSHNNNHTHAHSHTQHASQQGLTRNGGAAGVSELKRRKRKPNIKEDYSQRPKTNEYGEALYCYCNQVAYGEMVGCDGDNCILEWFHLPCIGLETLPKGKWYCNDCKRNQ
ncbi:LAME_0H12640g1_1 [Lachancea meyersii CBS 8951]|uniref:Chromatin modification-related protein n=1 Tax=Lachancea meyersii CBS 8951 TaxID=1266667 RepID=A0A1G4KGS1_9SACH|nr:LAME_0H12640g1_1 [Lachancea meyersii CBS 8951]